MGVHFMVRMRRASRTSSSGDDSDGYTYAPFMTEPDEEDRIRAVLEQSDSWGFNVFDLAEATGGRPLQTLGWYLLRQYDSISRWGLNAEKLRNFLAFAESAYQDNPYHNGASSPSFDAPKTRPP